MAQITTNIFSTNRTITNLKIKEAVLPTTTGELGILPNHIRLLTALDIGVLRVKIDSNWVPILILDGFAYIKDNELKIIVRQVEELSDIKVNLDQATKDLDEIIQDLSKTTRKNEKLLKTINFKRALARFQVLSFTQPNRR